MTAGQIIELLRAQYEQSHVFYDQVVLGSIWGAGTSRGAPIMDAVAIRKSWTRWCVHGFEVKVSRADFLADKKWRQYLPHCNRFSFVCPRGVIGPADLPDPNMGLIWTTENGLYTRKAAQVVNCEPSLPLLCYLVLWRGESDANIRRRQALRTFADWQADKRGPTALGKLVSKGMATRLAQAEVDKDYREIAVEHGCSWPDNLEMRLRATDPLDDTERAKP